MERKRPYWMVAVSLLFSLFATFAFVIIGYKAIVFFMPFVVGWILSSIATPVVNWLERRFSVVKKTRNGVGCRSCHRRHRGGAVFCGELRGKGSRVVHS